LILYVVPVAQVSKKLTYGLPVIYNWVVISRYTRKTCIEFIEAKVYHEQLFNSFLLIKRVPQNTFYQRLREISILISSINYRLQDQNKSLSMQLVAIASNIKKYQVYWETPQKRGGNAWPIF